MGSTKGDDLEFLTATDMEDEYSESSQALKAAPATTNLYLGEAEDEASRGTWTSALKRTSLFKESRHPGAAFFHLLFKTLAVLFYMPISGMIGAPYVIVCVVCILLLAFDFWTVKNVTGRLLVGLRWWNYVKEDGTTEWVFESADDASSLSPADKRIFWVGLYAPAVVWSVFLVVAILLLRIQWLIVVVAALSLSGANIVGYTKCSKDASQRLQKFAEQGVAQNLVGAIGVSNILTGIGAIMNKQQQAPAAAGGLSGPNDAGTVSV
mmetsp:Transcript_12126/g.36559  ORF Transcript_12126/g.36559 Transcript_12126/m.36559 type:complete len:266 (-) Transcript_12126:285-1082(-)